MAELHRRNIPPVMESIPETSVLYSVDTEDVEINADVVVHSSVVVDNAVLHEAEEEEDFSHITNFELYAEEADKSAAEEADKENDLQPSQ
jgi:hypothetical protein